MRSSTLWLLFWKFAEEFLGNYRGSLRKLINFQPGDSLSIKRSFEYSRKKFLKGQQIRQNKNFYQLTDLGRRDLLNRFPLLEWRKRKWDGVWRVVMYDFPEEKRGKRDLLRRFLKKLGFAQWQISVWVSPYPIIERLDKLLVKYGLGEFCSVHESKRVVGVSDKKFAKRVWKLDEINDEYRNMVEGFDKKRKLEYLENLMEDPFLPKELLPDNYLWEKLMRMIVALPPN